MKHIVPVSGGKDSQLVLHLVLQKYPRKDVVAVFQRTGYDHELTYAHLRYMARFYRVRIHETKSDKYKDLFDFVQKAGYFPNNAARGCTSRLKQKPFAKWLIDNGYTRPGSCVIHLGMRADESKARTSKYGELEPDDDLSLTDISADAYPANKFGQVRVRLDVVNLTTEEVFAALRASGAKVNPLYSKGHTRVGCYPCLLANTAEWRAAARDTLGRRHIRRLLKIEDKFKRERNPRKFIKVHPTRDVRKLLSDADADMGQDADTRCGWCSI